MKFLKLLLLMLTGMIITPLALEAKSAFSISFGVHDGYKKHHYRHYKHYGHPSHFRTHYYYHPRHSYWYRHHGRYHNYDRPYDYSPFLYLNTRRPDYYYYENPHSTIREKAIIKQEKEDGHWTAMDFTIRDAKKTLKRLENQMDSIRRYKGSSSIKYKGLKEVHNRLGKAIHYFETEYNKSLKVIHELQIGLDNSNPGLESAEEIIDKIEKYGDSGTDSQAYYLNTSAQELAAAHANAEATLD